MGLLPEELGVEICLNEPVEECLFDGKKIVESKQERILTLLRNM